MPEPRGNAAARLVRRHPAKVTYLAVAACVWLTYGALRVADVL